MSQQMKNASDEVDVTINQGSITRELQLRVGESLSNEITTNVTQYFFLRLHLVLAIALLLFFLSADP